MYPVSVRDCPSNERGVLDISIGDLTLKNALLLLTPLSPREILKISILLVFTSM